MKILDMIKTKKELYRIQEALTSDKITLFFAKMSVLGYNESKLQGDDFDSLYREIYSIYEYIKSSTLYSALKVSDGVLIPVRDEYIKIIHRNGELIGLVYYTSEKESTRIILDSYSKDVAITVERVGQVKESELVNYNLKNLAY